MSKEIIGKKDKSKRGPKVQLFDRVLGSVIAVAIPIFAAKRAIDILRKNSKNKPTEGSKVRK